MKFAPHNVNKLFGAISEPVFPKKEPKFCTQHPTRKAIWQGRGVGYCWGCKERAVTEARKR